MFLDSCLRIHLCQSSNAWRLPGFIDFEGESFFFFFLRFIYFRQRRESVRVWDGEGQRQKERKSQADSMLSAAWTLLWGSIYRPSDQDPEIKTGAKTESPRLNQLCHQAPQKGNLLNRVSER